MSSSPSQPSGPRRTTTEALASIAICVENEDLTVRPLRSGLRRWEPLPPLKGKPTAEDLAGIPVCVENEDLTVRPIRPELRKRKQATKDDKPAQ